MSLSLLSNVEKASYDAALSSVFATFARPLSVYLEAQIAVVNTNPTFGGMFGDASENAVGPTSTPVTPQRYTITGCVLYGNKQPWEYVEPASRGNYQQNKIRESFGSVRIKVDATGHALLSQVKQVVLDGFTFQLNSTARPHGLVGSPTRWTYTLQKVD